ncbi:MAG: hypothetical protein GXP38_07105 [Chloroflexi bacterium]|nr:hypothetical protein [Chloroflexota bacterium]
MPYQTNQGASVSEYALILALITMLALGGLWALGQRTVGIVGLVEQSFPTVQNDGDSITIVLQTSQDFIDRMEAYHQKHGRWPRSWSPYNFSDIGLDPQEWAEPRDGVIFNPAGNRFGLANALGDEYQLYVTNIYGEDMHIYDGYNIWYNFEDGQWYYHDIADNIPVDINSLRVIEEAK